MMLNIATGFLEKNTGYKLSAEGRDVDSVKGLVLPTNISLMQLYMLIHLSGYLTGYIRETPDMD